MPACDRRYFLLATGTICLIQLSCIIEEWIFKQLHGFHYFWFVALIELLLFTVLGHASSASEQGRSVLSMPSMHPSGPMRLYAVSGCSLAAGTGLGKLAFKHLNYATGTVLKSMKLLPVMALSVCWLQRRYNACQLSAALLMVASASLFGLGEREVETEFSPTGILLSFLCLFAQALQNTSTDRLLRDHGATVHETMTLSNGWGFLVTLLLTLYTGELLPAVAFFSRSWVYWALLLLRCVLFYLGALLYTRLMQDSGAVAAVFVTTMRKALTVVISFLLFPKPWTEKYAAGGLLLLAAIVCEYHGKAGDAAVRPRQDQSSADIARELLSSMSSRASEHEHEPLAAGERESKASSSDPEAPGQSGAEGGHELCQTPSAWLYLTGSIRRPRHSRG